MKNREQEFCPGAGDGGEVGGGRGGGAGGMLGGGDHAEGGGDRRIVLSLI